MTQSTMQDSLAFKWRVMILNQSKEQAQELYNYMCQRTTRAVGWRRQSLIVYWS